MGPRIEHASVVACLLLGQVVGHFGLRWANGFWNFLPDKSSWLVTIGLIAGLVAYFAILWIVIGLILLAGRFGFIDLKDYNSKYPGMR